MICLPWGQNKRSKYAEGQTKISLKDQEAKRQPPPLPLPHILETRKTYITLNIGFPFESGSIQRHGLSISKLQTEQHFKPFMSWGRSRENILTENIKLLKCAIPLCVLKYKSLLLFVYFSNVVNWICPKLATWLRYFLKTLDFSDFICVGHTAWALEGRPTRRWGPEGP